MIEYLLTLILILHLFIQGSNNPTILFTLLVANRMLPQRIATFVLSAHSEMANLLSFPILGMSFKSVLNNTGPSELLPGWAVYWSQNFCEML